jgi:hypothetical protein
MARSRRGRIAPFKFEITTAALGPVTQVRWNCGPRRRSQELTDEREAEKLAKRATEIGENASFAAVLKSITDRHGWWRRRRLRADQLRHGGRGGKRRIS